MTLTGCTSSKDGGTTNSGPSITVGATDQVTGLDPAGARDAGSGTIESEVYATLLSQKNGSADVSPTWRPGSSRPDPSSTRSRSGRA
ncbi:hypothetical protein ABZ871_11360 [Streptomyces populi]